MIVEDWPDLNLHINNSDLFVGNTQSSRINYKTLDEINSNWKTSLLTIK